MNLSLTNEAMDGNLCWGQYIESHLHSFRNASFPIRELKPNLRNTKSFIKSQKVMREKVPGCLGENIKAQTLKAHK